MKKKWILIISLVAVLTVAACSGVGTSSQTTTETQTAASGSTELPLLSKLVVGTYKLIGSTTPVTQSQAGELVILWKAYKELQTRDTKAQQEVTDLLAQINSNYSSDQVSAISAMNLSVRDVMTMAQELGVNTAQATGTGGSSSSRSSSSGSATSRTGGAPGDFGGGGLPPDMGGGGFVMGSGSASGSTSSTPSASIRATMQARRSDSTAQTTNMAAQLIEPLIVKLEAIANPG